MERDRELHLDIEAVQQLVDSGAIVAAVKKAVSA